MAAGAPRAATNGTAKPTAVANVDDPSAAFADDPVPF